MLVLKIETEFTTTPKPDDDFFAVLLCDWTTNSPRCGVVDMYVGTFEKAVQEVCDDHPTIEHFITDTCDEPIHRGELTLREAIVAAYRVG